MGRSDESTHGARRRTVLKLLSAAAGAATVPALGAGQTEAGEYAVVQDGECIPVTPLSGEQPVEEFYDWREGETGYSSAGTVDLQRDDTSILFLYDGPRGTSLVLVHGHYQGSQSGGGSVSMTFTGLPEDGEWVVEDDRYDGPMNYDNWNHGATSSEIDWTYRFSRTDGGAFRSLDGEFELLIEPAFNDASEFGDEHYDSQIADWQVRNQGTVGGTIVEADPSGDYFPVLTLLDPEIVVEGPDGRRELPFSDFYLGMFTVDLDHEELVTEACFEKITPVDGAAAFGSTYAKHAARSGDYAIVGEAAIVHVDDDATIVNADLAVGAVGPLFRAEEAEGIVEGTTADDDVLEAAADAVRERAEPDAEGREGAYKKDMAGVFAKRAIRTAYDRATEAL
jgi:hypothetical protein